MINLNIFAEDELEYIVSVIPRNRTITYLNKNSKQFNKIKPGFRATALPDKQLSLLLYKELQKHNDFVVKFVVDFLEKSLQEISDAYRTECQNRNETTALIYTLNNCYFRNRLVIYFKLVNQEISQTELDKLVSAMDILQESIIQQQITKKDLEEKQQQILSLEKDKSNLLTDREQYLQEKKKNLAQNKKIQAETTKCLEQNNNLHEEIARCSAQNTELHKRLNEITAKLQHNEKENQELAKEKEALSSQLAEQIEHNREYLQKIEKLEQALAEQRALPPQHSTNGTIWSVSSDAYKYYIPVRTEEFQELISYYIEDSGIDDGRELLTHYITKIAFSGKPIVGNRQDCRFLVNCISNILTNGESITLNFSDEITIDDVSKALNSNCRIVYLDNFIGNFNETVLYSILEKYHNKIVLISAMYDKTFNYVGIEFLSFCHYCNISRLKYKVDVIFDAERFEEKEYVPISEIFQNAPTLALSSILREAGFPQCTRQNLLRNIKTHDEAISILSYCVIPYLFDVKGINPFDSLEKLYNYCNKNHNRDLLKRWFVYE